MPIITVLDNENNTWKRNAKKHNKDTKGKKGRDRSFSEMVRATLFCCAFKLGFLQLICKASLFSKSILELALSIILKQKNCTTQSMLQWSVDV